MSKTEVIRFRVTPEDRAAIAELARKAGENQSEAIRRAVHAALNEPQTMRQDHRFELIQQAVRAALNQSQAEQAGEQSH